jgi:hypothetical protein
MTGRLLFGRFWPVVPEPWHSWRGKFVPRESRRRFSCHLGRFFWNSECFGFHFSALGLIFRGRWEWQETWFRVNETLLGGVRGTSESEPSRCCWRPSSSRRYFFHSFFVLGVCGPPRGAPRRFLGLPGVPFWKFVRRDGCISRRRHGARAPVWVRRCQSGLRGRFTSHF